MSERQDEERSAAVQPPTVVILIQQKGTPAEVFPLYGTVEDAKALVNEVLNTPVGARIVFRVPSDDTELVALMLEPPFTIAAKSFEQFQLDQKVAQERAQQLNLARAEAEARMRGVQPPGRQVLVPTPGGRFR